MIAFSSPALKKILSALVMFGGLGMAPHIANAADLYSDDPPPTYGSAYDDPRYADLYGRSRPRVEAYREEYREYGTPPIPRAPVYRDRYADRGCPSKDEISRRLERNGWRGFHNPQVVDRQTATIDAQRPNGQPFRLEVDRCTGEILAERPLDRPRYGYGYDNDNYGPYAQYDRRPPRSY